VTDYRRSTI